jgi:hypothetical protein
MLTEAQKATVRRLMGYPSAGAPLVSPGGGTLAHGFISHRFHQVSGLLEFRMNWMQPVEEAMLTGLSSAMLTVSGSVTAPAQIVALSVTPNGQNPVAVQYSTVSGDNIATVAVGIANAILASQTLVSAGFSASAPIGGGAFALVSPNGTTQPFPGVQITAPDDFQITATGDTSLLATIQAGSGVPQEPTSMITDAAGTQRTYRGFINILSALQSLIGSVSDNLDTTKADVWTARSDEMQARVKLFNYWRGQLAAFFDIPLWEHTGIGAVNNFRPTPRAIA